MTTTMPVPRTVRLAAWMTEHNITYRDIAEQLGVSAAAANKMLKQETMPTQHHAKCVFLGFPHDLLPTPFDKKPGRRVGKPFFPGLAAASERASA